MTTIVSSIREQYNIINGRDYIIANNQQWRDSSKLEKDFYLTAILHKIAMLDKWYIFKGWTCLNKCHFGYYRLSEDLDFSLIVWEKNRTWRSNIIQEFFDDITKVCSELWLVCIEQRKRDTNHFGWMKWQYTSVITNTEQIIIFDIKTYISFSRPPIVLPIQDVFNDIFTGIALFPKTSIKCMSLEEAMAEKMRAALTRNIPAIRDFYDIRYAQKKWFDFMIIRDLISDKVEEVGWIITIQNDTVSKQLHNQIETDLRPVVFWLEWFDLDAVYKYVLSFAK